MTKPTLILTLTLAVPTSGQVTWPTPSVQIAQTGANAFNITVTIPQGGTPGTTYYTDHFQFVAVSNGIFDPTYDSCMFIYSPYSVTTGAGTTGAVSMFNDSPFTIYSTSGYSWSQWTNESSTHIAENSQCKIDAAQMQPASNVNGALVVTVPVQVKPSMMGDFTVYLERGDWTRPPPSPYFSDGWNGLHVYAEHWKPRSEPLPDHPTKTVNPAVGTGYNPAFDLTMTSTGGATNSVAGLTRALFAIEQIGSINGSVSACYLIYHRSSNELAVVADGGASYVGSRHPLGISPGPSSEVQGPNCKVDLGQAWYTESGTTGRLVIPITGFTSSFSLNNANPPANIFFVPIDKAGQGPASAAPDGVWVPSTSVPVQPRISDFSPNSGGAGTAITINGQNFGVTQGSSLVKFNNIVAAIQSWSPSQIVATLPSGSVSGPVTVVVGGVQAQAFAPFGTPPPALTFISIPKGPPRVGIVLTGVNFGDSQGASVVKLVGPSRFGGVLLNVVPGPGMWSNNSVTVQIPIGTSLTPSTDNDQIVIVVGGSSSLGLPFKVTQPFPCTI